MSSVERGFIPLPEAQSEQVKFDVSLPEFVEPEKIGVNLRGIERLCQIGGIKRLLVVGLEDMDTSQVSPQIVGFNKQGSAYMGKAASKLNVPPSKSLSEPNGISGSIQPSSRIWANAVVALNMDEVKRRISEDSKLHGVRSPKAWAHYLNNGVKDGLSQEGTKSLLHLNSRSKAQTAWVAICAVMYASGMQPFFGQFSAHIPDVSRVGLEYLVLGAGMNIYDRLMFGKRPKFSDKNTRYSLFYGPQVDRAALLKILSKTGTYVKSTEK